MKNNFIFLLFLFCISQLSSQSLDSPCVEEVYKTEGVLSGLTDNQSASKTIYASNIINNGANANYNAGLVVYLKKGFHAKSNSNFKTFLDGCIDEIDIFPNPTNDVLNVVSASKIITQYCIVDKLNKIITEEETSMNQLVINLENLPSNLYFIKFILNNGQIIVKKVIKR